MCTSRKSLDGYTKISIACALIAGVLVCGYFQSVTRTEWTYCTVDVRAGKISRDTGKRLLSKRLFCNHDARIIAIRQDHTPPHTPEAFLTDRNVLSCSYDVISNPFRLLREQVLTESLDCGIPGDIG